MDTIERLANSGGLMWIAITVIAVGPSIAWAWTSIRKTRSEYELKRTMIEQGMSADEIERVLAAGSSASDKMPEEL